MMECMKSDCIHEISARIPIQILYLKTKPNKFVFYSFLFLLNPTFQITWHLNNAAKQIYCLKMV